MADLQPFNPLDQAIAEWLDAKSAKSNSLRTAQAYRDTMADFRAALAERSADLLSDPALVALTAEQWATQSRVGRAVTPATFNLRLAIVSSFYVYYSKKAALSGRPVINPIAAVERHPVQAYHSAVPLDLKDLNQRLKSIDRTTLQGKRDYALLTVLTATGRRLSEICHMQRGDLVFGDTVRIAFPHCKGGKHMADRLTTRQSTALLDWLHAYYGTDLDGLPAETPIWVSLSRRNPGAPMGSQTVGDICEKYLGTAKVHTLRHTFAVAMEKAGAPISEIQSRLGHESAATTSVYLKQLHAAENPYAEALDDLFGIGE